MLQRVFTATTAHRDLRWVVGREGSRRLYEIRRDVELSCTAFQSSELTFVVDGEALIELGAGRQQIPLRAGDACLLLRATPHRMHVRRGTRFVIDDLDAPPSSPLGAVVLPSRALPASTITTLEHAWEGAEPSGSLDVDLQRGRLVELEAEPSIARALPVKRALEASFSAPVSLDALARAHDTTPVSLLRDFKRAFGVAPRDYLQALRLEHFAWTLMHSTSASLTELSLASGYGDYSTFCRRVRQRLGAPPSGLCR